MFGGIPYNDWHELKKLIVFYSGCGVQNKRGSWLLSLKKIEIFFTLEGWLELVLVSF
jgi:hypothetical protein